MVHGNLTLKWSMENGPFRIDLLIDLFEMVISQSFLYCLYQGVWDEHPWLLRIQDPWRFIVFFPFKMSYSFSHHQTIGGDLVSNRYEGRWCEANPPKRDLYQPLFRMGQLLHHFFRDGIKTKTWNFLLCHVSMLVRTWGCQCEDGVLWISHHVLRPWTSWMIHRWTVQSSEGRDADLVVGLVVQLNDLLPACLLHPIDPYLGPLL